MPETFSQYVNWGFASLLTGSISLLIVCLMKILKDVTSIKVQMAAVLTNLSNYEEKFKAVNARLMKLEKRRR